MNRNERAKMLEKKTFHRKQTKAKISVHQWIWWVCVIVEGDGWFGYDLVCLCERKRMHLLWWTNDNHNRIFHIPHATIFICYLFSRECARVRFRSHEFKYIAHYVANMRIIIVLIIFVDVIWVSSVSLTHTRSFDCS